MSSHEREAGYYVPHRWNEEKLNYLYGLRQFSPHDLVSVHIICMHQFEGVFKNPLNILQHICIYHR